LALETYAQYFVDAVLAIYRSAIFGIFYFVGDLKQRSAIFGIFILLFILESVFEYFGCCNHSFVACW
jgi:hypothetical protein